MATALGDLMRKARDKAGKTQEQIATELEMTQPVIHKWESGDGFPGLGDARRVAHAYGLRESVVLSAIVRKAEERARDRRRKRAS